jgi:hypothetical protein
VIGGAFHSYPISMLEEVFRWVHSISKEVPAEIELQLLVSGKATGVGGPGIELIAPVFADSLRDALRALAFLNKSKLRHKAALKLPFAPSTMSLLYRACMTHYPDKTRWAVDNMWTSASIDQLLPGLHRIVANMPPPPSHMLWLNWAPPPDRPDMAFSMEDEYYIALYGGWKDAADDARHANWAKDHMSEMEHLATGCQLADENLGQRPARFVKDDRLLRLDQIRARRDPQSRFHSWMGRL